MADLGSVGWHTVSVKLEMEVAGELQRIAGKRPQLHLRIGQGMVKRPAVDERVIKIGGY